jgi:hypothetical protein
MHVNACYGAKQTLLNEFKVILLMVNIINDVLDVINVNGYGLLCY